MAPKDVVRLLGMPKIDARTVGIESSSIFLIQWLTCITMGASFGVALDRKATIKIVKDSNPPPSPFLLLLDAGYGDLRLSASPI